MKLTAHRAEANSRVDADRSRNARSQFEEGRGIVPCWGQRPPARRVPVAGQSNSASGRALLGVIPFPANEYIDGIPVAGTAQPKQPGRPLSRPRHDPGSIASREMPLARPCVLGFDIRESAANQSHQRDDPSSMVLTIPPGAPRLRHFRESRCTPLLPVTQSSGKPYKVFTQSSSRMSRIPWLQPTNRPYSAVPNHSADVEPVVMMKQKRLAGVSVSQKSRGCSCRSMTGRRLTREFSIIFTSAGSSRLLTYSTAPSAGGVLRPRRTTGGRLRARYFDAQNEYPFRGCRRSAQPEATQPPIVAGGNGATGGGCLWQPNLRSA